MRWHPCCSSLIAHQTTRFRLLILNSDCTVSSSSSFLSYFLTLSKHPPDIPLFSMTVPPSHYSERYINQRYNKALQIVQHLPATSSFQPTREEKLQVNETPLCLLFMDKLIDSGSIALCILQASDTRGYQHCTTRNI